MRKAEGKGEGEDKQGFEPLYFIHMYDNDPKKIEMSFDLTVYQPQFKVLGHPELRECLELTNLIDF